MPPSPPSAPPAANAPPSVHELVQLAASANLEDRAFADGALRLAFHAAGGEAARAEVRAAYESARIAALDLRRADRAAIRDGSLRGQNFRAALEACRPDLRDHWFEELLGIAHAPLEPARLERNLVAYVPSGVAELLVAVDAAELGPHSLFVDLGAGLGKALFLAHLVTGARCAGVEIDEPMTTRSSECAESLGLEHVRFALGDARDVYIPEGDAFYLYVPFTGPALDAVLGRLRSVARTKPITVCSPPLDLEKHAWLERTGRSHHWLDVHRSTLADDSETP